MNDLAAAIEQLYAQLQGLSLSLGAAECEFQETIDNSIGTKNARKKAENAFRFAISALNGRSWLVMHTLHATR